MKELALIAVPPGVLFGLLGFFVRKWMNDIEFRVAEFRQDLGALIAATKFDLKEVETQLRALQLEVKAENKGAFAVLALQVAQTQERIGELEKIKQDLNVLFERGRAGSNQ